MDGNGSHDFSWDLDRASLKALGRRILADRPDRVCVTAGTPASLQQVERLGYPLAACSDGASAGLLQCVLLPQLRRSVLPLRYYDYRATHADITHYGTSSGDMNPVHFDDDAARAQGFEGRICHGMLFNGWFTRLLGTEYPGPGALYLRSQCQYLAPVYPERDYRVRISTPRHVADKGLHLVVAQLTDAGSGQHAVIAYADVMQRAQTA